MKNIQLDLHGIRHEFIQSKLIKEIEHYWNTETELKIITGHSIKMKKLVIDILKEYKLEYRIGDFSGLNDGFITTIV